MANAIKFGKAFEFSKYSGGWRLVHTRSGINTKTKEPCVGVDKTYHSTLSGVANTILDLSLGKCKDMEEILKLLRLAKGGIISENNEALLELVEKLSDREEAVGEEDED